MGSRPTLWRCWEGERSVPLGEEARTLDLLSRGGWSAQLSCSVSGPRNTSPKALGIKTKVKAIICCCSFFHLQFDLRFSSGKCLFLKNCPLLFKAIIIHFWFWFFGTSALESYFLTLPTPAHDSIGQETQSGVRVGLDIDQRCSSLPEDSSTTWVEMVAVLGA